MTPEQVIQKLLDASRQANGSALWHEELHAAAVHGLRELAALRSQLEEARFINATPGDTE